MYLHYTLRGPDVKKAIFCYTGAMIPDVQPRVKSGGEVQSLGNGGWKLSLHAAVQDSYRWAQVDDYIPLPRSGFHWNAPVRLRLQARINEPAAAGTWGFGLWNDPFAMNLLGGTARRLPALPNAAWFFYSLPPNHLTLRDDAPGHGFLAQVFSSPRIPSALLAPAGLAAPLLVLSSFARLVRGAARRVIHEDSARIHVDVTQWHEYALTWQAHEVRFTVDGMDCLVTSVSPRGPLGLVLWIDNQYLAFPPDGRLRMGTLPVTRDTSLELREISMDKVESA